MALCDLQSTARALSSTNLGNYEHKLVLNRYLEYKHMAPSQVGIATPALEQGRRLTESLKPT